MLDALCCVCVLQMSNAIYVHERVDIHTIGAWSICVNPHGKKLVTSFSEALLSDLVTVGAACCSDRTWTAHAAFA